MKTLAVVLERPEHLVLSRLAVVPAGDDDVVVDIEWSGISTGTERLLWTGRMPPFPGMGYPLVPGYESVGRVSCGRRIGPRVGERVFVPGARCFGDVRGLFGGAASRLVVPARAAVPHRRELGRGGRAAGAGRDGVSRDARAAARVQPDLIVGHGVLGRLLARLALAAGAPPPVVWERNPSAAGGRGRLRGRRSRRRSAARLSRRSTTSAAMPRCSTRLIARLAPGGEIVLAGFYSERLSLRFPPRLHARGADPRRRRMAAGRPARRQDAGRVADACRSTA